MENLLIIATCKQLVRKNIWLHGVSSILLLIPIGWFWAFFFSVSFASLFIPLMYKYNGKRKEQVSGSSSRSSRSSSSNRIEGKKIG